MPTVAALADLWHIGCDQAGIAHVVAVLATGIRDCSDTSMRWEGGVAVGFTAVIVRRCLFLTLAVGVSPLATAQQQCVYSERLLFSSEKNW